MNRENISFSHLNFENDGAKIKWLLNFLEQSGPTIIYVSSKKVCLELANMIYDHGYLTGIYHGDLSYQERHTVQNQFMENFIPVIVATSAFGMGVNKKTLEQSSIFIYQQVLQITYKKLVEPGEIIYKAKRLVYISQTIAIY